MLKQTAPTVNSGYQSSERCYSTSLSSRSHPEPRPLDDLPDESLTVVVFSNIYYSAATSLGYDLTALSLGLAYQKFSPLSAGVKNPPNTSVTFQFGSDFYQPNARLTLKPKGLDLFLLWPTEVTALIPVGEDTFIDRSYWVDVKLERDAATRPSHSCTTIFREKRSNKVEVPFSASGARFSQRSAVRTGGSVVVARGSDSYFPCGTNIDRPKRNAPTTMISAPA